jgi:hypothetical protein
MSKLVAQAGRRALKGVRKRVRRMIRRGERLTVRYVASAFRAAGLTPLQQHVLTERLLNGRSHGAITADAIARKADGTRYTRQRIAQLEKVALGRLGADNGTIDRLVTAAGRADVAIQKAADASLVEFTDLAGDGKPYSVGKVALVMRERAVERAVDRHINAYIAEKARGKMTPKREQWYADEFMRINARSRAALEAVAAPSRNKSAGRNYSASSAARG